MPRFGGSGLAKAKISYMEGSAGVPAAGQCDHRVHGGPESVWAVYANDVLTEDFLELIGVGADIGTIAETIYEGI